MYEYKLMSTAGGHIQCPQCTAKSKRSGQRCQSPAIRGKTKCRIHGGKSTGPKTEAGRQRCAEAKTVHGRERRKVRAERSIKIGEIQELEYLGRQLLFITGPKTRGRKVKQRLAVQ